MIDKKNEVDHPSHYNTGEIEAIEYIADQGYGEGFCIGSSMKYLARAKHKGNYQQDLEKARWYLDWWIENGSRFDPKKGKR